MPRPGSFPPPFDFQSPHSFARHTLLERLPQVLDEALKARPGRWVGRARVLKARGQLGELLVQRLELPAEDAPLWEAFFARYAGRRLAELPFFEGEAYFYAWILAEMEGFGPGRDPFVSVKRREFIGSLPALRAAARAISAEEAAPPRLALRSALRRALLGNLADSSNPQLLAGSGVLRLVHDEPSRRVEHLLVGGRRVQLLADNALSELFYDLALARSLARASPKGRVEVVLKRHPMFVSDATPGDVELLFSLVEEQPSAELRRVTQALRRELAHLRVVVRAWRELNAPLHLSAPQLVRRMDPEGVLLLKGDANGRRALEDRAWPASTPLARACRCPVGRVLFLRVLKSECVAGLPPSTVRRLSRRDPAWRTNGTCALTQILRR